ncbi:hypothetical protein H2248_003138 [Termitomyces sp. 'cryptogamus']|nr:hypothetical protein H2248_003138 [Termitomyces sp. 'cryptogamus']
MELFCDSPLHILSGSFRSPSLFLLAFEPGPRTLELVQTVPGFGPHQYLATSARKDRIYTTSWALPPVLSSWSFDKARVGHVNNVPITATSSYITVPAPFTHAYSAGGPAGEVHAIDPASGALSHALQQLLFVPPDDLPAADKTRAALRYGAHALEVSPTGHVFVPVLGTDSIEMYTRNASTGLLAHLTSVPSPRATHDGPRHVKIHPNGRVLYSVTEHTNLIDAYAITATGLTHLSSRSLVPPPLSAPSFRGDTLILSPSTPEHPAPRALFASTRGASPATPGWLSTFLLDADGMFVDPHLPEYWQTPTSGGKANALDVISKSQGEGEGVWILLTDDDEITEGPGVWVLEWDGWGTGGVRAVVGWPPPGQAETMQGGSHAVWLD